jgi:acetate kinase
MTAAILVLNAGSSSLKFALYGAAQLDVLCKGHIEAIGYDATFKASGPCAAAVSLARDLPVHGGHDELTTWLLGAFSQRLPDVQIVCAGHRVVHGGTRFNGPVRIDEGVLVELDKLVELAPGHEPHSIAAIRAVAASWPDVTQVACFDTAFHSTRPPIARVFGLPHALSEAGIVRYGFHGLSYEYIASVLPDVAGERANGKVIVAHLGNGASMCAMYNRHSVATTMGYTALDGLLMGTRCGAIDPGVILHLIGHEGMSVAEVTDLLNTKSGLSGVSGLSSDVRVLEASDDPRAEFALALFAYRAIWELGALVAVLGGLDLLVFTGGIGEHSAGMRRRICATGEWAGIVLDPTANATHESKISQPDGRVGVFVIPTDEERVIARATRQIVTGASA